MKVRSVGRNQTEIEKADGTIVLYSYETPVAAFVPGVGGLVTDRFYSNTTSRHISQTIERWGCSRTKVSQGEIDAHAV